MPSLYPLRTVGRLLEFDPGDIDPEHVSNRHPRGNVADPVAVDGHLSSSQATDIRWPSAAEHPRPGCATKRQARCGRTALR